MDSLATTKSEAPPDYHRTLPLNREILISHLPIKRSPIRRAWAPISLALGLLAMAALQWAPLSASLTRLLEPAATFLLVLPISYMVGRKLFGRRRHRAGTAIVPYR